MIPIPTADSVIIEEIARKEVTDSGIHIPFDPHVLSKTPNRGVVVRVGPGRIIEASGLHVPMETKAGDSVIFSKNTGVEVSYQGKKFVIIPERDVIAIEV